jgi:FAD/FMN-containing dehydrogenase
MLGDHSSIAGDLYTSKAPQLSVPIDLPAIALNRITVGAFNTLYYYKHLGHEKTVLLDYEPFFYPLDSVLHWNRIYGRNGLLQFQCVLPEEDPRGIVEILSAIASSGLASFLAVIKIFGSLQSPGTLSFPRPGITLALDFPVRKQVTFALVDRLAEITLEHGGRMYPAKDARMTPQQFQTFYPQWREFASFIDPAFNSAFWQRVTANA